MTPAGTPVKEIAETLRVGRGTLHRALRAHSDGRDCALIVYRNTRPKTDHTHHRYGETGAAEKFQLEADRKWFPTAPVRRPRLRATVYVADGVVVGVRAVTGELRAWNDDDSGYPDITLGPPLTDLQIARQPSTPEIELGDPRPHVRDKIREYVTL